jgi:protein-disulfide isomerase
MAGSQSKFYGVLAAILIAGGALIAYVVVNNQRSAAAEFGEYTPPDVSGELVSADVGVSRGSPDALLVIEEYADYQCPACGMVGTLTIPQIFAEYVDTGKARFVFYDFPLRPGNPLLGANAARCAADQNAYWAMQKVLFGRMREWGTDRNPKNRIRQYADGMGIDGKALVDCIDAGKYSEVVLASQTRARQLGVEQTPTFFINGQRVVGAMGYDQMVRIIEEELAKLQ